MLTAKGVGEEGREWQRVECSEGLHAAHLGKEERN